MDNAQALPKTPQAPQQQEVRSIHVLQKAVNLTCLQQVDRHCVQFHAIGGILRFDAGKNVTGRKRHILNDMLGPPLAICGQSLSIQDPDGFALFVGKIKRRFHRLKKIFASVSRSPPGFAGEAGIV